MMNEQVISFETAKLAKELGFDVPTQWMYIDKPESLQFDEREPYNWNEREGYSAPTQSLLQKWLRENHNIQMNLKVFHDATSQPKNTFVCDVIEPEKTGRVLKSHRKPTYEEALEEGLKNGLVLMEAIEITHNPYKIRKINEEL
jgi:hypothetical protein